MDKYSTRFRYKMFFAGAFKGRRTPDVNLGLPFIISENITAKMLKLGYTFFRWGSSKGAALLMYFRTTRCYLSTIRGGKLNFKT